MSKIKLMTAQEMEEKLEKESGVPGLTVKEVSILDKLINKLYEARKNGDVNSDGWYYNETIITTPRMIEYMADLGYEVKNIVNSGFDDTNYYYTTIRVKPSESNKRRKV